MYTSNTTSGGSDSDTYLLEGMLNNHLPVCVRDAREQISDSLISLLVNLVLGLWNWLRHTGLMVNSVRVVSNGGPSLFDDCLPNVMAGSVQMVRKELVVGLCAGLWLKLV